MKDHCQILRELEEATREWFVLRIEDRNRITKALARDGDDEALNGAREAAVWLLRRRNPGAWRKTPPEMRERVMREVSYAGWYRTRAAYRRLLKARLAALALLETSVSPEDDR